MRGRHARIGEASAIRPRLSGRNSDGAAAEAVGIGLGKGREIGCAVIGARDEQELDVGQGQLRRRLFRKAMTAARQSVAMPVAEEIGPASSTAMRSSRIFACNGPGSLRRIGDRGREWSCRFWPTPGSGTLTAMPCARSSSGSPMPDSIRSCGELITPPARMTSRSARATWRSPRCRYSTPTARLPSNRMRVASAPSRPSDWACERRAQIGDRGAAAPAVADRHLQAREASCCAPL